jgi:hypothetical protein
MRPIDRAKYAAFLVSRGCEWLMKMNGAGVVSRKDTNKITR